MLGAPERRKANFRSAVDKVALLDPEPQIDIQTSAFARYTVNQPRTVGFDLTYRFE